MSPQMKSDMTTLELAKLYESQGYYEDAYKIYSTLEAEAPSSEITSVEIQAGLKRTQKTVENYPKDELVIEGKAISPKEKISFLLEKWLTLMVLKKRLERFKKIKFRLS